MDKRFRLGDQIEPGPGDYELEVENGSPEFKFSLGQRQVNNYFQCPLGPGEYFKGSRKEYPISKTFGPKGLIRKIDLVPGTFLIQDPAPTRTTS